MTNCCMMLMIVSVLLVLMAVPWLAAFTIMYFRSEFYRRRIDRELQREVDEQLAEVRRKKAEKKP